MCLECGLSPKRLIDKSQAYFWTKKWQDGEKTANDDIKNKRVKVVDTVEELMKELE
jgi:TRAP-type C4-dicarboxylate transport system substrate-binding protein